MCRAPARPVCACFVRSCCRVVVQEHDLRDHVAMQRQANLFFRLHTALFSPRTSHFALHTSCTSPFTLHSSCSTPHFITTHLISALPIPLWRPRLHTTNFYTQQAFTQRSFYTESFYTQQAFTQRSFCTQQAFTQQAFTHRKLFTHSKPLHTASFYAERLSFTHRNCKAKKERFWSTFWFQRDPRRTRRTQETSHGKTPGFVLRLPPQDKPRATVMQPLQCVLQQHMANTHLSTHMATRHDKNLAPP